MNKYKNFVLKYSLLITSIVILFCSLNYLVDPYGIFKSSILEKDYQPNERFIKADYLLKNQYKYNSYMLGSSRIGNTDPKLIESNIQGSKFYNLTAALSNLKDYNVILKWMIKNKFDIKNLYLQIDLEDYHFYGHDDNLLFKHHYLVENSDALNFYVTYLSKVSFKIIKKKIKYNFKDDGVSFYFYSSGMWRNLKKEKLLKDIPLEYVKNESSFHKNYEVKYKINSNYENIIDDLKYIKKLCDDNNINLICFTTPHNHNMMDTFDRESVLKFLNDITKIMDIWYFSGYNYITNDDTNYYEYSHYKEEIAKKVADVIFAKVKTKGTFGIHLTKLNKAKALEKINENIIGYRTNRKELFEYKNNRF
ncbi:hypothetical protein [Sulfurimonas sp.]|uniref:hypothetical protein n=1 Tax=Sulfurimonas sp. TaxID=2022749 RepID=UPI003565084D